ncbi:hypothetical protein [Pseudogulbenkiania subflava]|uniref:hypothetical protein n=1 Tax=Pseudogulbenkiania subflava TaxID=451637 RepID=UPI001F19CBAC
MTPAFSILSIRFGTLLTYGPFRPQSRLRIARRLKALVDPEQILTRLRAEGYDISPSYDGADLVVVNACDFIDSAVAESMDAIGEALTENGKVIVTGCLGAKGVVVRDVHPSVLAVTGPHATRRRSRRYARSASWRCRPRSAPSVWRAGWASA